MWGQKVVDGDGGHGDDGGGGGGDDHDGDDMKCGCKVKK